MNIIVPTYHCRLWWVRARGKFTQTYLSKLVNNFIILLLPDSQTLLQVKHRVLDDEGKSILLEKTTSNNAEENHSEYESRVQKLRIESVAS